MIGQILRVFELNTKEQKTFKAVREFGTQPASNISRTTGIPRNSVRFILDALVKKGLLVKNNRGNTQFYTVERPENIIRHIKIRQTKINDKFNTQIKLVKDFGAEINPNSRTTARKPKITFYEGLTGLEKVYEHTLSAKKYIRSWANYDGMHEALPAYFATYYKRRFKKGITITSIHPDSERARKKHKLDALEGRVSIIVPADKYSWVSGIRVYDDFINITSWTDKLGIIIESHELAKSFASIFDLCARSAKEEEFEMDLEKMTKKKSKK